MFKNGSKENSQKVAENSEIEKIFRKEAKPLEERVEQHQKKINNLIEIVSARFGEDVEDSNVNKKIQETIKDFTKKINNISDKNKEQYDKCIGLIYTNEEIINEIKNSLSEKDAEILELNKQLLDYLERNDELQKEFKEKFGETNKKIGKINYVGITNKFDKMLKEENKKLAVKVDGLYDDLKEKISSVRQDLYATEKSILKQVTNLSQLVDKNQSIINDVKSSFDEKGDDKVNVKEIAQALTNKIVEAKAETKRRFTQVEHIIADNTNKINDIKNFATQLDENKKALEDLNKKVTKQTNNFNGLVTANKGYFTHTDNIKKELADLNKKTQKTFELVYSNIEKSIKENNDTINAKIDELKNNELINESKKQTQELSTKLENNEQKYAKEKKDIEASINDIKKSFDSSIKAFEQEILDLKEKTNNFKQEGNNNSNIDDLKKSYDQYVKKVDTTLEKLTKSISAMQTKNTEGNKNLQIRIKNYIDAKNSKTINQINDAVNKLSLSFAEKEKLQQAQIEQLVNKKVKLIQKENEKLIKRQIEELNSSFGNNGIYSTNNLEPVTYGTQTKKKKSMFDFTDDSNLLMQSASSKKDLGGTKEEKPQILKFFYDDDDDIN